MPTTTRRSAKTGSESSEVKNNIQNEDKTPKPPTTPCSICKTDISEEPQTFPEESIECECCMKWYHCNCAELKEEKYRAITSMDLHWYCPPCENGARRLKQHIVKIETEQDCMKQELKALRNLVEESENRILTNINSTLTDKINAQIDERVQQLQTQVQQAQPVQQQPTSPASRLNITTVVNDAMKEKDEIMKRKLNLVIHNMKEPTGDETEEDLLKILVEDKLEIDEEITIADFSRLGNIREEGKPRSLKISLDTLAMKRKILSCATKLRKVPATDAFARVYVKPDLTAKQQEESKNLERQLKDQRAADRDHHWVIYRGKVIRADTITRS